MTIIDKFHYNILLFFFHTEPPYFNTTWKTNTWIPLGDTLSLYCDIIGPIPITVMWFFDGQPLNETPKNGVLSEGNKSLVIERIQSSHTGWYTCCGINEFGVSKLTTHVQVVSK